MGKLDKLFFCSLVNFGLQTSLANRTIGKDRLKLKLKTKVKARGLDIIVINRQ